LLFPIVAESRQEELVKSAPANKGLPVVANALGWAFKIKVEFVQVWHSIIIGQDKSWVLFEMVHSSFSVENCISSH
jgi:hypothetical protein